MGPWPVCRRTISSASSGATETILSFGHLAAFSSIGMVSVMISSSSSEELMRSMAGSERTPWVQAPTTVVAPRALSLAAARTRVSAVSAISSITTQTFPATSPTRSTSDASLARRRCREKIANGAQKILASTDARLVPLTSGLTTTTSSRDRPLSARMDCTSCASSDSAEALSTGYAAKPWIWGACSSTVSTAWAPATCSRSVMSRAVIGERLLSLAF
mmetsp:Transcript_92856/g.277051  ORF Transcript_92856/g.277051 Transcript_92856/m.277051 type:complete len:218 (-) Transcript_92856:406-1059(-)